MERAAVLWPVADPARRALGLRIVDGRRAPPSVRRARAAALRQRGLELRVRGASFRAIAGELGVGLGTAHRYVERAIREQPALNERPERLREYRAVQLERLRVALHAIWPAVLLDEPQAVRTLVAIVYAEARLTGTIMRPGETL